MKQTIKKLLIKILHPLILKLGYKPKRELRVMSIRDSLLKNFYLNLIKIDYFPKHIVDIGANVGGWTKEALKYFPEAYYTMFEPQMEMKKSVQDLLDENSKVSFNALGVGSSDDTLKFTIHDRDDSCSFKYSEEEAKERGFEQIEVDVVTLNKFFKNKPLPVPDIIKIDAEGYDIEVLKGASDFFGKTEIFMVEVAVMCDSYENSPDKVINFMAERGYKLAEMTDAIRPFEFKMLWLLELVFIKENGLVNQRFLEKV